MPLFFLITSIQAQETIELDIVIEDCVLEHSVVVLIYRFHLIWVQRYPPVLELKYFSVKTPY